MRNSGVALAKLHSEVVNTVDVDQSEFVFASAHRRARRARGMSKLNHQPEGREADTLKKRAIPFLFAIRFPSCKYSTLKTHLNPVSWQNHMPFDNTFFAEHHSTTAGLILATIFRIGCAARAASGIHVGMSPSLESKHLIEVLVAVPDPSLERQVLNRLH
jgi:hypothetical protein